VIVFLEIPEDTMMIADADAKALFATLQSSEAKGRMARVAGP